MVLVARLRLPLQRPAAGLRGKSRALGGAQALALRLGARRTASESSSASHDVGADGVWVMQIQDHAVWAWLAGALELRSGPGMTLLKGWSRYEVLSVAPMGEKRAEIPTH